MTYSANFFHWLIYFNNELNTNCAAQTCLSKIKSLEVGG